jgi:predicted Fe-S protein YdhL (DUF1289 family)
MAMSGTDTSVASPCVRKCCLNEEDICLGCFRSLDEIIHWSEASDTERRTILASTVQRREAHRYLWKRSDAE